MDEPKAYNFSTNITKFLEFLIVTFEVNFCKRIKNKKNRRPEKNNLLIDSCFRELA